MTIVNWALTVMRNNCLFHNEGAANFPHTQPMAEVRRNQRGEIGRQILKAHSCSRFTPCLVSPQPPRSMTAQFR